MLNYQALKQYRDVTLDIEAIDPDTAREYLTNNTFNRVLSSDNVSYLVREINGQKWKLSDSAICFGPDGRLLNGQHRLTACVRSGRPIVTIVARNVPSDCLLVMDQNSRRKTTDLLLFAGVKPTTGFNLSKLGTVINNMIGSKSSSLKGKLSAQFAKDFADEHYQAIDFALSALNGTKKLSRATVIAVVARAYYHVDHDTLFEFCQTLCGHRKPKPGDEAVFLLKTFLLGVTRGGGSTLRREVYFKTERAIKAFVDREPLGILYQANRELFPLPAGKPEELEVH